MGEVHRKFAAALTQLADTDGLIRALDAADGRPRWWPGGVRWTRTFGRFEPDQTAYATLALESTGPPQVIVLVKVCMHDPASDAATRGWAVPIPPIGVVRILPFPNDPVLSTLGEVWSDAHDTHVVRYRPEKRCTLRIDGENGPSWVKVFADRRGEMIHRSTVALWDASQRGELAVSVAPPIRFDPHTRAVWQGHVTGSMITKRLFGDEGPTLAERLGSAAGSVTAVQAHPELRFDGPVQVARSRRYVATIARVLPELQTRLDQVVRGLERLHERAVGRPRPIHGAPHPEQWLDDDGRLGLIDFDRFSLGDPELDITTFQAEVDFERLPAAQRQDINDAFLAGYESRAGAVDPTLLVAYRAHKRLAKVLRSARAVRPDGDVRAARHLESVIELVTESPR